MTNNNDLFVREVDEELRQDQLKSFWRRFAPFIIGAAVAIVVGVGRFRAWEWYSANQANASGDRFLSALEAARNSNSAGALDTLNALQNDGSGAYPLLARLKAAALTAETDPQGAVTAFDAIAADSSIPAPLRDIARLRAGYLLVDTGSYADVSARVEVLTADGNAMRYSALEAMALAAYKAGDLANAGKLLEPVANDPAAPASLLQRAQILLDLIAGQSPAG
jgi:hypothetical protein